MPPDPVGRLERSRARPPAQLSRGPVRCSRATRAALLLRCPLTPSASPSALALGLPHSSPGGPSAARARRALRCSDAP